MRRQTVIYALRHEPTGKMYVGSTTNIGKRIQSHIELLKRGEHPAHGMQDDFNKYGGPYTVHILEVLVDPVKPTEQESLWMSALNSRDPQIGYNAGDPSRNHSIKKRKGILFPMDAGAGRDTAKKKLQKLIDNIDSTKNFLWHKEHG